MGVGYGSQLFRNSCWDWKRLSKGILTHHVFAQHLPYRGHPSIHLLLDTLWSSVEENCCRNRTRNSKQYLQNIQKWIFYSLIWNSTLFFLSQIYLLVCFVKMLRFSTAERLIPRSSSSMANCKLKNNKNNLLGVEPVCRILWFCSLP